MLNLISYKRRLSAELGPLSRVRPHRIVPPPNPTHSAAAQHDSDSHACYRAPVLACLRSGPVRCRDRHHQSNWVPGWRRAMPPPARPAGGRELLRPNSREGGVEELTRRGRGRRESCEGYSKASALIRLKVTVQRRGGDERCDSTAHLALQRLNSSSEQCRRRREERPLRSDQSRRTQASEHIRTNVSNSRVFVLLC